MENKFHPLWGLLENSASGKVQSSELWLENNAQCIVQSYEFWLENNAVHNSTL